MTSEALKYFFLFVAFILDFRNIIYGFKTRRTRVWEFLLLLKVLRLFFEQAWSNCQLEAGRHDTQYTVTHYNDAKHNETRHYKAYHIGIKHNDMVHNDMDHNDMNHNDTDYNDMYYNDMDHNAMWIIMMWIIMTLGMVALSIFAELQR